jgi:hypothetical protein
VTGWRDESGCKQLTAGNCSTRLQDVKTTNYLLFVLSRLLRVDGNLHIVDRKVKVGGNMTLSDISGSKAVFSPIAIIHHTGQVTGNTTSGHYQADVLDVTSNKWIRTSDDNLPVEILESTITDQGYIILYKKQHYKR